MRVIQPPVLKGRLERPVGDRAQNRREELERVRAGDANDRNPRFPHRGRECGNGVRRAVHGGRSLAETTPMPALYAGAKVRADNVASLRRSERAGLSRGTIPQRGDSWI